MSRGAAQPAPPSGTAWPLLLGVLALLSCGPVDSPSSPEDPTPGPQPPPSCPGGEAIFEELSAWVEAELQTHSVPGAAVAVLCEDRLAWSGSWGEIRTGWGTPVTPQTRFQLASTTKMFTAAAALSLVEDGVVDLTAPLDDYVPYANVEEPFGVPLDLHSLMSHSAGYPTWFPEGDFSSYELSDYFANNTDQPLWSRPGAVFNYSNLGMSLAGLALQEASGEPFGALVDERVFEPAGMVGATMDAASVESRGDHAWGHTGLVHAPSVLAPTAAYFPTGYYAPMGGAWASVEDLAAWGEVLLSGGGEVLSSSSVDAMTQSQMQTRTSPAQHYGYGLFIDRLLPEERWTHGGSVMGFLSSWIVIPELGIGVFALVNCDWYSSSNLTNHALDLLVGPTELDLTEYLSSSDDWPDYVGTYLDPVIFGTIEVREDNGELIADFVDEGFEAPLTGVFEDSVTFWHEGRNQTLRGTFWREGDEGPAEWFVTLAGVAARVD